jgi:predicted Co/Zn/Cd cation transporter (cation efflux family)
MLLAAIIIGPLQLALSFILLVTIPHGKRSSACVELLKATARLTDTKILRVSMKIAFKVTCVWELRRSDRGAAYSSNVCSDMSFETLRSINIIEK